MTKNSTLDLEYRVLKRMKEIGWENLTPVQMKSYPVILRRKSSLLLAPTGSGKTEAAVIPLFTLLGSEKLHHKSIKMLYVTPLKALNRDILRRVIGYAESAGLSVQVRHGDTSLSARRKMTDNPPDVMITTPETLAILLTSKKMRLNLTLLEWIVVDELHELLGNERGSHLAISLERLEELSENKIVRIGLSATVANITEAAKFLVGSYRKCAVIIDRSERKYHIECKQIEGPVPEISEKILNHAKERAEGGSILLFTNTRDEAEYLGALLKAKSPDIPVEVHHGSLAREVREETEEMLRSGEAGLVVSTSSLELGMDIGVLNLVIQWGSPRQAVKLVQRIGRSRHRVAEEASGLIITNRLDDELESLALIKRMKNGSLEDSGMHHGSLDVMAHHIAGMTLEHYTLKMNEILSSFKRAYPFRDIEIEDVELCLQILDRQGVIRYTEENIRRRGPRTYEYYYNNISTIPDVQQFTVMNAVSKKPVGRVDQMFVGDYGEPGKPFLLKGNSWKIVSIDDEKQQVYVEPVLKEIATAPYWVGELIPVDFHTAVEVGRIRKKILSEADVEVSEEQRNMLVETKGLLDILPDDTNIVIEKCIGSDTIVIHMCFGTKVNQTLATILSTLISSKTGYLVETRLDPYRIILTSQGQLDIGNVSESLKSTTNLHGILQVAVVGTNPFNWKIWHVARRFGVVMKGSKYDRRASKLIQGRYRETALYREALREFFLEKYDLDKTEEILQFVKEGKIEVVERVVQENTPLAKPIFENSSVFAPIPLSSEKSVLELVKERLAEAKHRLVCLSCGKWQRIIITRDAEEKITCSLCRSRLITATYYSDVELSKLIIKKLKGKRLVPEDVKKLRKAWKISSLIQNFGITALQVLSGFGVGPEAAGRILKRYIEDDDQLLKDIYRAEKNFVTTRGFWD